jgi:hypothetical protein
MKPVKLFPEGADARNKIPLAALFDYFPLAMIEIAKVIQAGNDQHNPGEPVHWAREKSTDHGNKVFRHWLERGTLDSDGTRHTAKAAWRVLAELETECEMAQGYDAVAEAKAAAAVKAEAEAAKRRCPHSFVKERPYPALGWGCVACGEIIDDRAFVEACL